MQDSTYQGQDATGKRTQTARAASHAHQNQQTHRPQYSRSTHAQERPQGIRTGPRAACRAQLGSTCPATAQRQRPQSVVHARKCAQPDTICLGHATVPQSTTQCSAFAARIALPASTGATWASATAPPHTTPSGAPHAGRFAPTESMYLGCAAGSWTLTRHCARCVLVLCLYVFKRTYC
jgi:hypothetical protein